MSESRVEIACHCGAARPTVPHPPEFIAQRRCSLCTKTGWRGAYYAQAKVTIGGEFDDCVRADLAQPKLRLLRCRHCGAATHWTYLTADAPKKIGINANLFDHGVVAGIPVHEFSGEEWL